MLTQDRINELIDRVEGDGAFATSLENDLLATLREHGYVDLVVAAEDARESIRELIDRIDQDDEFRRAVEHDPTAALTGSGLPEAAVEPVLLIAGAPDEVLERAAADVEAHAGGRKATTVAAFAAVLGAFALAQQASAGTSTTPLGASTTPLGMSTTPLGTSTTPLGASTTPLGASTTPLGNGPERARWRSQPERAKQGSLASFLRSNRIEL